MRAKRTATRLAGIEIDALILDLDGVITRTARVHAAAWKRLFDDYLRQRATRDGTPFSPFDAGREYAEHVDGKPRYDGVRDFLASRGIELPLGTPDDPPEAETVAGLGNRKNILFVEALESHGAEVFEGSVRLIRSMRAAGLGLAVVSASRNCQLVLRRTGLLDLFDVVVDGLYAAEHDLPGKPAPDTFLCAARSLGVPPERAAVVEDALAGVAAGRAGGFGLVIGVDRGAGRDRLSKAGADIVVGDLAEVSIG